MRKRDTPAVCRHRPANEWKSPFTYGIREPSLTAADADQLKAIREHFADAHLQRPRTREGVVEVMDTRVSRKDERVTGRLVVQDRTGRTHVLAVEVQVTAPM